MCLCCNDGLWCCVQVDRLQLDSLLSQKVSREEMQQELELKANRQSVVRFVFFFFVFVLVMICLAAMVNSPPLTGMSLR